MIEMTVWREKKKKKEVDDERNGGQGESAGAELKVRSLDLICLSDTQTHSSK